MRWLITYDITEDGTRSKVERLIARLGVRVQKSVFESQQPRERVVRVLADVQDLIDPRTDSILAYPIHESAAGSVVLGRPVIRERRVPTVI